MSRSEWQDHDLETLRGLQDAEDPRGLEQMIADDQFVEVEVEKATRCADGFEVSFDGGLCTFLRVPDGKGIDMCEREARGYVGEFRKLPHDEQAKVIHAEEPDEYGISGHQFDCACGMAMAALMGREV